MKPARMNPALRDELAEIIRTSVPAPTLELAPTGELLPREAMELARLYASASVEQRSAFDALAVAFRQTG